MLRILLCAVLILSGSIVAEAATLRAVRMDRTHFKITGSINEDDLFKDISLRPSGLAFMYITYDGFYSRGNYGECSTNKSQTLARVNSLLASGIIVNRFQAFVEKISSLNISCHVDNEFYSWATGPLLLPPVDENSPNCTVSVASVVDLGTVTVGSTAKRSLQGQIRCDKSATVNVQLTNPQDKTAPAGTLKIDDATLQYDVDGVAAGKNYSVPGNGSTPFNLNFNLTDSGKTPGGHSGNLVLLADVV